MSHGAPGGRPVAGYGVAPAAGLRANNAQGSLFLPPGITSTRPISYSHGIRRYGAPGGGTGRSSYGYGYGVGYGGFGYPGYLDFGYLAGSNSFDPDDPNNGAASSPQNTAQDAFVNAPPDVPYAPGVDSGSADFGAPPPQAPTPYVTEPGAGDAAPPPQRPAAPLPEEDAVTIVFKDGRAPEQIRNYALTRTALYVTSGRVRTIPVADIDLPATEKANQKAGVEFQLPSAK